MINHHHFLLRGLINHVPDGFDTERTRLWIKKFLTAMRMEIEKGPYVSYITDQGHRGMTACWLIKTSHLAFHIWDEEKPAVLQFDFYTCGELDFDEIIKLLKIKFHLTTYDAMHIERDSMIIRHREVDEKTREGQSRPFGARTPTLQGDDYRKADYLEEIQDVERRRKR